MCPICLANLVLLAASAGSSGGLTAFALTKFVKEKQTHTKKQNENCTNKTKQRNRVAS
jgi:membrane protein YqaA with SNARE-associated domain